VIWLIGVDPVSGVTGTSHADLANWWPAVKAEFDGLAPVLTDLNIPWKSLTVVALVFETDRVPFVVKNPVFGKPGGGPVALEVPWREGTSVRSARRDELVRLLAPMQVLPHVEVMNAWLELEQLKEATDDKRYKWQLLLDLYVTPRNAERITIPFHRCRGALDFPAPVSGWLEFDKVSLGPFSSVRLPGLPIHKLTVTAESTRTEVHFDGPANVYLRAVVHRPVPLSRVLSEVGARVSLLPTGAETLVSLDLTLREVVGEKEEGITDAWVLGKRPREWGSGGRWW
jgi:hypothetical protein